MRVPLSWLREYVELLAGRDRPRGRRPPGTGGPRGRDRPRGGHRRHRPLVVGRVVDLIEETHSNGKTIRWCQVDVGEDRAAGNRLRRTQLRRRRPRRRGAARRRPARRVRHHRPQDLRARVRRHDLLRRASSGLGDDHAGIIVLRAEERERPATTPRSCCSLRDDVLDIAVTPDRGYCLSMRGVAREVATAYGVPLHDPGAAGPAPAGGGRHSPGYPVVVDDADRCAVYVARTVTGLDLEAVSPRWLQRRLQLAGMRPISLAVDVTNYVMLELGQPMHGFDRDALTGPIVVRRAAAGEKLTTLDGAVRDLDPDDLLITDDSGPIGTRRASWAARRTEMGASTTPIVIEAAHFDADRRRAHGPAAQAAQRGRRSGSSAASTRRCRSWPRSARSPTCWSSSAAATADAAVTDRRSVRRAGSRRDRRRASGPGRRCARTREEVAGLLAAVGGRGDAARRPAGCRVVPPTWRPDLTDPFDLVEEVARLHGYDAIPSVLPAAPRRARAHRPAPAARGRARAGRGRLRRGAVLPLRRRRATSTPSACPRTTRGARCSGWPTRCRTRSRLRTTLLPGAARGAARATSAGGCADVALFESGLVFRPGPSQLPARRGCRSTAVRPTRSSRRCCAARARPSRGASPSALAGDASRPAGGGRPAGVPGPTRSRRRGSSPRRPGSS